MQAVLKVFGWGHWKQLYEVAEQLHNYIYCVYCSVVQCVVCVFSLSCQPITFTVHLSVSLLGYNVIGT